MQHHRPTNNGILVLDYGSQYTLLIARRLREIGIYAEIIDGQAHEMPQDFQCAGIILSGGPDSVTDGSGRQLPQWVLSSGKPVLGICYGMQLLIESSGGRVSPSTHREYGKAHVVFDATIPSGQALWDGLEADQLVWMSHGDSVQELGAFEGFGTTESGVMAAICHKSLPYFGLQFHPEVHHSQNGKDLLANFCTKVCQTPINWDDKCRLEATKEYIRHTVGDGSVLMAVSGGVDSTVAVTLMAEALGPDKVTPVLIDNGLLRKDEAAWVASQYEQIGLKNFTLLHKQELFLKRLAGISDPEQKRKVIGLTFIEVFEEFATAHKSEFTHLGQGTLYPDVIESAGHGSGAKVIKSHHNVGGLPEHLQLALVEPFRFLFKDEVRQIGRDLKLPEQLLMRHPFPGPGLAVRVLGELDAEKLDILREADQVFINRLHEADFYHKTWQAFAVLLPVKTVGVMGDNRTYQWTCALRAVCATDGMTAGVTDLPLEFLVSVSDQIVRHVDGINRVVYDITTKPPSTIEWE